MRTKEEIIQAYAMGLLTPWRVSESIKTLLQQTKSFSNY